MRDGLPSVIDPIGLAESQTRLAGSVPFEGMTRLSELCLDQGSDVRVDLQFEPDPRGYWTVQGMAECELTVSCQRCLQPLALAVGAPIRLVLVRSGMPEDAIATEESILTVSGPVSLPALVEDELLLALPMAPRHAIGECPVPVASGG